LPRPAARNSPNPRRSLDSDVFDTPPCQPARAVKTGASNTEARRLSADSRPAPVSSRIETNGLSTKARPLHRLRERLRETPPVHGRVHLRHDLRLHRQRLDHHAARLRRELASRSEDGRGRIPALLHRATISELEPGPDRLTHPVDSILPARHGNFFRRDDVLTIRQ